MQCRTSFQRLAAVLLMWSVGAGAHAQTKEPDRTGGPYVPTPQVVVDQMLRLAKVGAKDYVMDLGSGDGVIVLTAARQFQASGMGVEIDPELVKLANNEAKKLGIADRATFRTLDVFKADLSPASVVTLYLLPAMMMNLRDKIFNELKPGTRVVSHDYHFGDWQSDDQVTFDVPEKEKINGIPSATLYLWVIPAKVSGRWQIKVDGVDTPTELALRQSFSTLTGSTPAAGRNAGANLTDLTLRGQDMSFSIWQNGARHHYRGRVSGDTISGTVNLNGRDARWQATRIVEKK